MNTMGSGAFSFASSLFLFISLREASVSLGLLAEWNPASSKGICSLGLRCLQRAGEVQPMRQASSQNPAATCSRAHSTFLLCFPHCQLQALKANENGLETQFHRRTKHLLIHFAFHLLPETANFVNCTFADLLP